MFWQRKLPHWVPEGAVAFVTWGLKGSLPKTPGGPEWLKDARIAEIVAEAFRYGETRGSYDLFAWVVMSNHIHIVIRPKEKLPDIVRWLKAATAVRANRLIGNTGSFWHREYYDHWVRSEEELWATIAYVEANPVRAGLVERPEDW